MVAHSSAFLSASYRQTTTGYRDYRRGSVLGASFAVQLAINRWSALVLGADLTHTEQSLLNTDHSCPRHRRTPVVGGAGLLLFALSADWLLQVVLQVPVVQSWHGHQFETATGVVSLVVDL